MATRNYLANVDLKQNEIQNASAHKLASAPANPVVGQEYFNTADNQKYIYTANGWVSETAQGTTYTEGTGIDITSNTISVDFSDVATAAQGALADSALQSGDNISELNNDAGYITGITSSDVTTALGYTPYSSANPSGYQANVIEGINVNSSAVTPVNKVVSLTIPTTAADVSALPASTKYAAALDLSINNTTYVITGQLKDQDGNNLGTAQTIDLPLESVVVSGSYDSTNKKIVLTLQSGSTIDVPVGDLVAGLQTEITSSNKLDADLVDDSTSTNKFVTAANKTTWNNKQDAISDLATIRSGAAAGATATQKLTLTNPALTASGGQCTWTITNTLGNDDVQINIKEVATGDEVYCDVSFGSGTITVKINSSANIAANTYKAVIIG